MFITSTEEQKDNSAIILKLIYFWAFIEAGLGGLLHLLRMPFTGFIVGGFAIIINILLAKYGHRQPRVILKALGIALAIKFLLSPHTPYGAYIAVGFQGVLAAYLFYFFGLNRVTIFLFTVIAMAESGIQKPAMAYFIFGNDFWETASASVASTFKISQEKVNSIGVIFFAFYLLLYIVWGFILGIWADKLRKNIENIKLDKIVIDNISGQIKNNAEPNMQRKKRLGIWAAIIFVFVFLVLIQFMIGNFQFGILQERSDFYFYSLSLYRFL
jgi:hypothetical protein